jgi:hypothetical protein
MSIDPNVNRIGDADTINIPNPRKPGSIDDRGTGPAPQPNLPDLDMEAWRSAHPEQNDDRPSWMTYPERVWCSGGHKESDIPEDRGCVRDVLNGLPLRRMDQIRAMYCGNPCPPAPATIVVELRQMPADTAPHVVLSAVVAGSLLGGGNESEVRSVLLTVAEAVDLAGKLVQHAEWGEQPPPLTPAPQGSASWQWTACPAWSKCEHKDEDGEGDQFHQTSTDEDDIVKVDRSLEAVLFSGWTEVPYIEVAVRQDAYTAESLVELSKGTAAFAHLLTGEARMLAASLVMLPVLVQDGPR